MSNTDGVFSVLSHFGPSISYHHHKPSTPLSPLIPHWRFRERPDSQTRDNSESLNLVMNKANLSVTSQ